MPTRQVLAVLALALLAAGCSGGGGSSAGSSTGSSAGSSATSTGTPSHSVSPAGSPSPSPSATSPSTPPLPTTKQTPGKPLKAKNGANLGSCRDGSCEVIIRPGDVVSFNRKLRTGPVRVLAISRKHLTLDMGGAVVGFGAGGVAGTRKVELRATAFRGHRAVLYVDRA